MERYWQEIKLSDHQKTTQQIKTQKLGVPILPQHVQKQSKDRPAI
jgi:hypothetical protein